MGPRLGISAASPCARRRCEALKARRRRPAADQRAMSPLTGCRTAIATIMVASKRRIHGETRYSSAMLTSQH
jgi:hypothetical protein